MVTWPPRSPDLSPIENAWSVLKRRVMQRAPRTIEQLRRHAQAEWRVIVADTGYMDALFGSMKKRLRLVVEGQGDFVSY